MLSSFYFHTEFASEIAYWPGLSDLLSLHLFKIYLNFLIILLLWTNIEIFLFFFNIVFPTQNGKVAIVTGGAKGIGYQTVKHLARLGMHVIIGKVIIFLMWMGFLFQKLFFFYFKEYFLFSISKDKADEGRRGFY